MIMWAVTFVNPQGQVVPTSLSFTEEGAYKMAAEAIDASSLTLQATGSKAQIAAAEALFESMRIRPVKLEFLDG